MVSELGARLEGVEQRGLADAVLTLDDDGALVAHSGDEGDDLGKGKKF